MLVLGSWVLESDKNFTQINTMQPQEKQIEFCLVYFILFHFISLKQEKMAYQLRMISLNFYSVSFLNLNEETVH